MFKIILVSVLAYATVTFADSKHEMTGLPQGTIGLASSAGGVVKVEPLCPNIPDIKCIANGTVVTLRFVGGCLDNLLPLTYETSADGREVFVHALMALNEKSRVAMCSALPVYEAQLTLINQYPPFKIRFMGTNQSIEMK